MRAVKASSLKVPFSCAALSVLTSPRYRGADQSTFGRLTESAYVGTIMHEIDPNYFGTSDSVVKFFSSMTEFDAVLRPWGHVDAGIVADDETGMLAQVREVVEKVASLSELERMREILTTPCTPAKYLSLIQKNYPFVNREQARSLASRIYEGQSVERLDLMSLISDGLKNVNMLSPHQIAAFFDYWLALAENRNRLPGLSTGFQSYQSHIPCLSAELKTDMIKYLLKRHLGSRIVSNMPHSEAKDIMSNDKALSKKDQALLGLKRNQVYAPGTANDFSDSSKLAEPLSPYVSLLNSKRTMYEGSLEDITVWFRKLDKVIAAAGNTAADFNSQKNLRALRILRRSLAVTIVDVMIKSTKDYDFFPQSFHTDQLNELLCSLYCLSECKTIEDRLDRIYKLYSHLKDFTSPRHRFNIIWHVCRMIEEAAENSDERTAPVSACDSLGMEPASNDGVLLMEDLRRAIASVPVILAGRSVYEQKTFFRKHLELAQQILDHAPDFNREQLAYMDHSGGLVSTLRGYLANAEKSGPSAQ